MDTIIDIREGLLYFADVVTGVQVAGHSGQRDVADVRTLPACLVTVLRRLGGTLQYATNSTMPEQKRDESESYEVSWLPSFWAIDHMGETLLRMLVADLASPTVMVMGEYDSMEWGLLQERGLLPTNVIPPLPERPHRLELASFVFEIRHASYLIIPSQQGNGHFHGIRIAVFDRPEEATRLYEQWLDYAREGRRSPVDKLWVSDDVAPNGVVAWASPFGVEDREHAILAKQGVSPLALAERLARELGLPLLISHCSAAEFQEWEDWHILPSDVAAQLRAGTSE